MSYQKREYGYQVRIFDTSNNLVAIYDDLLSLTYKKLVNKVGMAMLSVPSDHALLNYIEDDLLMEIYLTYPTNTVTAGYYNYDSTSDFLGLYRDQQLSTDQFGNAYYVLYFPATLEVLNRYMTGYPTGSNNKSSWVGQRLSVIANDVVNYNCTSDGTTANGRIRDTTVIRNMIDGGAVAGTTVVNYSVPPGRSVLEFLQELAPVFGFDFDVIRYGSDPTRLEVHQYADQLGSDLSASIIFSLSLDNFSDAFLSGDRLREKTVAIVGGAGEGATRTFAVATGANYSATNDYEIFISATDKADSELDDVADAAIAGFQARRQVGGNVVSSLGYVYGRDYNLGDLVSVEFAGAIETKKITSVQVEFNQQQNPTIAIEFSELT